MRSEDALGLKQSVALRQSFLELLVLARRLQEGVPGGKVAELRALAVDELRKARKALLGERLDEDLVYDVQLPVIALLDEAAKSYQAEWQPKLGMELRKEANLGEVVFERLEHLMNNPRTPVEVLEIYARCLVFGLQGRYDALGRPQELRAVTRDLLDRIEQRAPAPPLTHDFVAGAVLPPAPPLVSPLWVAAMALVVLAVAALTSSIAMRGLVTGAQRAIGEQEQTEAGEQPARRGS